TDAVAALDLRHDADHVHRIQAQLLAQVLALIEVGVLLAGVSLEDLDEAAANAVAVWHASPSWLRDSCLSRLAKGMSVCLPNQFPADLTRPTARQGAPGAAVGRSHEPSGTREVPRVPLGSRDLPTPRSNNTPFDHG